MHNTKENPDLKEALLSIRNIEKELRAPKKEKPNTLVIIAALIALFGTVTGYFVNIGLQNSRVAEESQRLNMEHQHNLISGALSSNSSRDRKHKLLILTALDLVPDHKERIVSAMDSCVVVGDELVFLKLFKRKEDVGTLNQYVYAFGENDIYSNYSNIVMLLEKSIDLKPNGEAFRLLGYINLIVDKYDLSIEASSKSLKYLETDRFSAYYNLAQAYKFSRQTDSAKANFKRALIEAENKNNTSRIQKAQNKLAEID